MTMEFTGADVLNGLSTLANEPSTTYSSNNNVPSGYFEEPLPSWLQGAACRGRNFLGIRSGKRKVPVENSTAHNNGTGTAHNLQQEDDVLSIAASEMTDIGRQNKTNFHAKSPRRSIPNCATVDGKNRRSLLSENRKIVINS